MVAIADVDLSPATMLPDLLRAHPQARGVFDRYGLSGCGGALGPAESIRFFARSHGVDEARLLDEIRQNLTAQRVDPVFSPDIADTIYRRYFLAGIIAVLTAGATWGAWILWRIGLGGSFTGISIHDVNAHGHVQIFGWVGLFIMGFAYQAFPRLWHTKLVAPRLAVAAFVLMLAGLVIGPTAMVLGNVPGTIIGGALECLASIIFTAQILLTFRRGDARLEPYVGFAVAALVCFVAMSFLSVFHAAATLSATTRDELLWYVATWQAPLRDLQVHGMAMLMIFAVSIRMLPALFDLPPVPDRRAWTALAMLVAGVVGEIGIYLAYRYTGSHIIAAFLMIPWLLLAAGAATIGLPWKLWRPTRDTDRSAKFIRTAYAWLGLSLVMLLLLPVYQAISHIPFSHAYYGAIRHAITVGFVSLMIMGVAGKVVPTLNGIDPRKLSALWGPFILINTGCFLRVSLQTLTDWHPAFFKFVGVSGVLEVTALAWWGLGLVRIMRAGKRQALASDESQASSAPPQEITPDMTVADVLKWFPQTEPVFERFGFTLLKHPLMRRMLAGTVTIKKAAAMNGVGFEELLAGLRQAARG